MSQHQKKSFIGISFIFITWLITKLLSRESTFSIKHSTNTVGVYKSPDFGFGNEICLSNLSILIMDKAFLWRCFLLSFDVVFLTFGSSLSRKLLQSNLDFLMRYFRIECFSGKTNILLGLFPSNVGSLHIMWCG